MNRAWNLAFAVLWLAVASVTTTAAVANWREATMYLMAVSAILVSICLFFAIHDLNEALRRKDPGEIEASVMDETGQVPGGVGGPRRADREDDRE